MEEHKDQNKSGGYSDIIHVMPSEYYGVDPDISRRPIATVPVAAVKAPTPPPPPRATAKSPVKPKNRVTMLIIIIGMVILVALLGFLVYVLYFSSPVPTPTPTPTPVVVVPEPQPEPVVVVPTPEPTPEPVLTPEPVIISRILNQMHDVDIDNDGLTDMEELMFGTKTDNSDTDGDKFLDGTEVVHLFNPVGTEPAKIEFSGLISTYVNPIYDYNIFYPTKWYARSTDVATNEVIFTSPLDEFVTLAVEERDPAMSLVEWYRINKQTAGNVSAPIEFVNTMKTPGLESASGFSFFFAKGKYVYSLTYDIGTKEKAAYPDLFRMMAESFVFTEKK